MTCTFTNTKRGPIMVDKVTLPSTDPANTSFDFVTTGQDYPAFSLTDAAAPNTRSQARRLLGLRDSARRLGPDLHVCESSLDDDEAAGSLDLDPGETITCVFTNTKRGSIIVEKQTKPDQCGQLFSFTGDGATKIADNGQIVVSNLMPGTYTSTEAVTPDWVLDSIVCNDLESPTPSFGDVAARRPPSTSTRARP